MPVTSLWITSIKNIWGSQAADSQPPASKRYCHRDGSSLSNCSSWFKNDYQGSKKRHPDKHWKLSAIQQRVYWRHYSHHSNQHTRQMDPQGFLWSCVIGDNVVQTSKIQVFGCEVANERLLLTLRHPADEKTGGAAVTQVRTGMVCEASRRTSQNNLKHQYMLGSTIRGREGLVTRRHGQWEKTDMREMWCGKIMVQAEVRNVDE